jgi:hypothetical protein
MDSFNLLECLVLETMDRWCSLRQETRQECISPDRYAVVEVDGPWHFAAGTRRPLGATMMTRTYVLASEMQF